jgi:hypothetical protein
LKQNNNQKNKTKKSGRGERNRMTGKASSHPPANVPMFYYDIFDDEENNTRAFKKREREKTNFCLK